MPRPNSAPCRRLLRLAIAGLLLLASGLQAAAPDEYQIKARILGILGGYVSWPGPSGAAKPRLTLGVIGRSPFGSHLDQLIPGPQTRNRQITVLYLNAPTSAEISGCDFIFICASETGRLAKILSLCKGKPIFTVADSAEFAQRGVMLNLLLESATIHLEVNLKAAREAGMEISAAFLAIPKDKARIVEGP